MRKLFEIAIAEGIRFTDPTKGIKRLRQNQKDLSSRLPSSEEFKAWVTAIRSAGGRFSQHCADFVEFLAYSGVRVGEAKHILWQHCDFKSGEILITGDPIHATKNHEIRRVPMIDSMIKLLNRMKTRLSEPDPEKPVCQVNEAQKAMDRAGKEVKIPRITHHDLRHLFATTCIESGIDFLTLAQWLGHKDKGALAMRVYGHLRNQHSLEAARKVRF